MRYWRAIAGYVGLAVLALLVLPFSFLAARRGLLALSGNYGAQDRLYTGDGGLSDLAIFGHMALGAVVALLAVVQLVGPLRRHWPVLHRVSGRTLALLAIPTALGGLIYIGLNGTIGGPVMNVGFALYGVLLLLTAIQAPRFAMAGDYGRHRRWGLRLAILALGSWLYRVHYGLWFWLTQGWGVGSLLDGPFDRIQVFAFYLPYLVILELSFRWYRPRPINRPA
ncbi:MAG: DUF2306 domain-containing protein [Pseudomonadota bacterium]